MIYRVRIWTGCIESAGGIGDGGSPLDGRWDDRSCLGGLGSGTCIRAGIAPAAVMGLVKVPLICRKGRRRCGWLIRFVLRAELGTAKADWAKCAPTIEISPGPPSQRHFPITIRTTIEKYHARLAQT